MELKQMKTVTFATIKHPCLKGFIRPMPVRNLNRHFHKSGACINLDCITAHGSTKAANLCFGDCFLNTMAPFLRAPLLRSIPEP